MTLTWKHPIAFSLIAAAVAACTAAGSNSDSEQGAPGGKASFGGAGGGWGGDFGTGGQRDPGPPLGARYSGKVWGPHEAGKAPLFPVPGALVAAYTTPPRAVPLKAYCEECAKVPSDVSWTTSNADGSFSLDLPVGKTFYLTVQKGQFRRVRQFTTDATVGDYPLPADLTTMPSRSDYGAGDTVPKIALVFGDYDHIEDVLAKTGMTPSDSAYGMDWSAASPLDVYDNSGPSEKEHHGMPLQQLVERMTDYHVIMFSCSYNANFEFMKDAKFQQAIREFVWQGGKLYASDYAQPVVEMAWPEFIWFHDPLHGGCQENRFPDGCNHGPPFNSPSTPKDPQLSAWLDAMGERQGLVTKENWNTIGELFEGYVGKDANGAELRQKPKTWVAGPWSYDADDIENEPGWDSTTEHPMTVSFPYNCGRVLYTTYHTVGGTNGGRHPGLLPQEKILYYLLMEMTVCADIPVVR